MILVSKKLLLSRRVNIKQHRSKPGSAPGTMVQHADFLNTPVEIMVMAFTETELLEKTITDPEELIPILNKYKIVWVNVCGLGNVDILAKLAKILNLNPLAMEDVLNVPQRPKVEEYGDVAFAIMLEPDMINHKLNLQQVSMFWSKNYVFSIQEHCSECFAPLVARLRNNDRRERMLHPEYLAYALLDAVIDNFFPILELYGNELDEMEEKAIDNTSSIIIRYIHNFKHNLHLLKRAAWAQREAMGNYKEVSLGYSDDIRFFIRDCEDHTIQLIDIIESYRERTASLMDIYLASVSNRTNRIMKTLTIMTAVFMPVGVLAGIFGMNFDRSKPANMPELGWSYGYVYFWCLALLICGTMLLIFWRRGWFKS